MGAGEREMTREELVAEIRRLRAGIIEAARETYCDDTWDLLHRILDGKWEVTE